MHACHAEQRNRTVESNEVAKIRGEAAWCILVAAEGREKALGRRQVEGNLKLPHTAYYLPRRWHVRIASCPRRLRNSCDLLTIGGFICAP
jgi:hypothetical protein